MTMKLRPNQQRIHQLSKEQLKKEFYSERGRARRKVRIWTLKHQPMWYEDFLANPPE